MERDPTKFLVLEFPHALRASANHLAAFVKCPGSDLAFIENATAGCNTVLALIRLSPGNEILVTDQRYPAIRKAADHRAARTGAVVIKATKRFSLGFPDQARPRHIHSLFPTVTSGL